MLPDRAGTGATGGRRWPGPSTLTSINRHLPADLFKPRPEGSEP
jgi:hypothetical protein